MSTDVAKLSRGFPSNAVLLCRYVAEHLARRNLPALDESGFDQGLHSFLDERGRATREVLTRIAVHDKLRHKQAIMFAAGLLELDEFTYDELLIAAKSRAAIEKRVFENVCLTFCIEGPEQVFGNPRAGLLRFLDPRMPMILHVMEYLRLGRG